MVLLKIPQTVDVALQPVPIQLLYGCFSVLCLKISVKWLRLVHKQMAVQPIQQRACVEQHFVGTNYFVLHRVAFVRRLHPVATPMVLQQMLPNVFAVATNVLAKNYFVLNQVLQVFVVQLLMRHHLSKLKQVLAKLYPVVVTLWIKHYVQMH